MKEFKVNLETVLRINENEKDEIENSIILSPMNSCKEIFCILSLENFAASLKIVDTIVSTEDLSEIFEPYTRGSPQAPETGFTVNGIDLNQKFKPL